VSEILPGVHQVEGLDPPDYTTHVYLVKDSGDTWTMIDTGLPGAHSAILAYLARIGVEPTAVKRILITHLHRDHVGSLKYLAERTKARTFSHWIEAAYLARHPPYDRGTPLEEPVEIDEEFKDGESINAAGGVIAYHTPGHTPGHTAYYHSGRRLLFCGDLFVVEGGEVLLSPPGPTHHLPTVQISARRIGRLPVDSLLTYHGGPILADGGSAMRALTDGL